ncbi:F0F1 ATP synthase subunit B [Bacilliculturomica massiliensis]|uniref:F0F1 ATP synthase subunit B n=1 Tax=Bacilliculturomica massiliensis TaxID=1917867 RepID=UPI001031A04A|nr:F0F1 ATP synthase subunit B [Bacilliculturomica massiliensis]
MLFDINWGFVFTIVNLLVLYLLLRHFLFAPIRGIMEQREELIKGQLTSAKEKEDQAAALQKKYEMTMAGAGKDAQEILEKARDRGTTEYDAIIKEAKQNAVRIMDEARRDIEAERERNLRLLSSELAGLAVAAAEKAVDAQGGAFDEEMMDAFLKEEGVLHD